MDTLIESDPASQILESLNKQQRSAVTFENGPLLIIAGAGTGKTSVITRRIAYLITRQLARPEEILALTYTDKAASEMEDRVDQLVPYGYAPVWISTFHAFGDRVLRRHAVELGLPIHFDILDDLQQKIFLLANLWRLPLRHYRPIGKPAYFLGEILRVISRAKDEDITPDEYTAYCLDADFESAEEREKQLELASIYDAYQRLMHEKGFLDFGDQVALTVRLFRKEPAVLEEYRKQFRYILVDEFQDTNYVQFQLLQQLLNADRNLTVVGDDDQSIYRFRGASLSNIMSFSDIYPDCHKIVLRDNYRSGQKILDAAYNVICNNNPDRLEFKHGINKRLRGRTDPDSILVGRFFETQEAEADELAKEIKRLTQEEGYSFADIAVLIRKNTNAEPYLESLRYYGIPVHFPAYQRFFRRPEILRLISFVHSVTDPQDSVHLFNLLCSPFYQLPGIDLSLIGGQARTAKRSLFWVIRHRYETGLRQEISDEAETILRKFLNDIERYAEKAKTAKAGEILYDFLENTGYLKQLVDNVLPEGDEIARNLSRFFAYVKSFSRAARRDDLFAFAEHLANLHDLGAESYFTDADPNESKVNVMTVHKAKGLEFPIVFLPDLVSRHFPMDERKPSFDLPEGLIREKHLPRAEHRKEERRLFYVGMTRAKDRLYLTGGQVSGNTWKRKFSEFAAEALELNKRQIDVVQTDPLRLIKTNAPAMDPLIDLNLKPLRSNAILELSYNQVNALQKCPLQYKIQHLLRVPVRTSPPLVLGQALHKGIEALLNMKKNHLLPFWDKVVEAYDRAWVSEGFLSREHEELRKEEGQRMLQKFYDREVNDPGIPFVIEEAFHFTHKKIRIRGRWDRVDLVGRRAVIIDYKSSDVQEQDDADKRMSDTLQLYIYALGFQHRYGFWPEAMELRFIDSGLIGRIEFEEKGVAATLDAIEDAAAKIRQREFVPLPHYQTCRYCPVRQICSYSAY